ncbi:MAG TPA: HIT domain-containing protein, partial [Pirellulales bacterium]
QSIVAVTPNFLAFCPFAARLAYETWIIPRQHVAHFDAIAPETLSELASLLRMVLVKLERIVKLSAYNYIVHTAPFDTTGSDHYHWHIEILPRTTSLAGFELGTGCYINTVLPERAATVLREA